MELTKENAASLAAGEGIYAKAPNGTWTLEDHLILGFSKLAFKK